MAYLLDTNAISETFRRRPNRRLVAWLQGLPREDQLTSTVVLSELYVAAHRAANAEKWWRRIEEAVLPNLSVLCFDPFCAREAARIQADLLRRGLPTGTADVQIAATARLYDLTLVTANLRHFQNVPGLVIQAFDPVEDGWFRRAHGTD